MSHEPKLSVYKITLNRTDKNPYNHNKWLFRNMIAEANTTPLTDSYILTEVFRKFINSLDTQEMYADASSKKCMTAYQQDIEEDAVNTNIHLHSDQFTIEGKVEGGTYGRRRNKTSTVNKAIKSEVTEIDAITEGFYFLLYCPFSSDKSVLMVQSYSDDTIDGVMKKFFGKFFSFSTQFKKPTIERFVPSSIIDEFKENSTVSSLSFSTEVLGQTLLQNPTSQQQRNFEVTVQIKPVEGDLSIPEYNGLINRIQRAIFQGLKLDKFAKKKALLRDVVTDKTTPFELDSTFDISPTIFLRKYISIQNDDSDFERIRTYCFELLESIKSEIYPRNALRER